MTEPMTPAEVEANGLGAPGRGFSRTTLEALLVAVDAELEHLGDARKDDFITEAVYQAAAEQLELGRVELLRMLPGRRRRTWEDFARPEMDR